MKKGTKASRYAAAWIAINDEPTDLDVKAVAGYTTTLLAADMLNVDPHELAERIVSYRIALECR